MRWIIPFRELGLSDVARVGGKNASLGQLPGGLARMEFVFAGWVGVHPLALTRYEVLARDVRGRIDRRRGEAAQGLSWRR
jgi:phosphoenolpyruvate synthase/pyruvate phosphate dikinase